MDHIVITCTGCRKPLRVSAAVQGKPGVLSVPVGSKANYLNGARLAVTLEERRLELAVGGPGTYQQRLAQDVADYLNGERAGPDPRGYTIPWYLFVPAVLPIGIP